MSAVQCPSCNVQLEIHDGLIGKTAKCSSCGVFIAIPHISHSDRHPQQGDSQAQFCISDPGGRQKLKGARRAQTQRIPSIVLIGASVVGTVLIITSGYLVFNLPVLKRETQPWQLDRPSPTPIMADSRDRSQSKEASFRTELFDEALRTAALYVPGENVKLTKELELIEFSIKGDRETAVFKALKELVEIQTDLNSLEAAKIITDSLVKEYSRLPQTARTLGGQLPQVRQLSAISTISRSGGIAVSASITPDLETLMNPVLSRYSITPESLEGVKWISYERTKQALAVAERALRQTTTEMVQNNGAPRK